MSNTIQFSRFCYFFLANTRTLDLEFLNPFGKITNSEFGRIFRYDGCFQSHKEFGNKKKNEFLENWDQIGDLKFGKDLIYQFIFISSIAITPINIMRV